MKTGELRERARVARDLHDTVKPALFAASMIAEVLPELWEDDPAEGRRRLAELQALTRSALMEVGALLTVWRPAGLDDAGLGRSLHQLAESFASRTQTEITVVAEGEQSLPADVALAFYRIAQEALNNMARHSGASRTSLSLRWQGGQAHLRIADNGRGFAPGAVGAGHLGLSIMHERAASIGAWLEVASERGAGTAVTVMWPQAERVNAE